MEQRTHSIVKHNKLQCTYVQCTQICHPMRSLFFFFRNNEDSLWTTQCSASCTSNIKLSTKNLRCFYTATATEKDVTFFHLCFNTHTLPLCHFETNLTLSIDIKHTRGTIKQTLNERTMDEAT